MKKRKGFKMKVYTFFLLLFVGMAVAAYLLYKINIITVNSNFYAIMILSGTIAYGFEQLIEAIKKRGK
jgi:hypothetical protein